VVKGADAGRRPITFAFNGGPGAASVYLTLGIVGPRIVDFGADGRDGAAARLVDNSDTWLAFTDLVMIDPIGTGWSRAAKPDGANAFWSVRTDASVIAKVIALYVAKNSRSTSPKYLLGESYGGFRAAKVAGALQSEQGIVNSGIVMISPLLETAFQWGSSQFALARRCISPRWSQPNSNAPRASRLRSSPRPSGFALTDYLAGLAGPKPSGDKGQGALRTHCRTHRASVDEVAKSRGWVRNAYLNHLRTNGVTVSSYDATFAIPDPYPESDRRRGKRPDAGRLYPRAVGRLRGLCA